jgi:hypothetical protein
MRPLTGKPDAGKLPVRFGGRGKVNPLFLPLSIRVVAMRDHDSGNWKWISSVHLIIPRCITYHAGARRSRRFNAHLPRASGLSEDLANFVR